jgi:alpha/beta superfamily hydrolase
MTVFRIALAVIAVHVVDDSFAQPQPGTSAADHLVSGLAVLAALALAAWAYPRLSGGRRGALALLFGLFGLVAGTEAVHSIGATAGDDSTGLLAIPAGLALLGLGTATLWSTRRTHGNRPWRYTRRLLLGVTGVVVTLLVIAPFSAGYLFTHLGRADVAKPNLGAAHERVSFTTSDGLELAGWYVPSSNGAAVIAFPGRNGPQAHTRMLVRHGYGVLLFDRRGQGQSEGDPHGFGWEGEKDIKAAIAFLQRRPDVDPERIGGLGLSVGGELMLQAAAETDALKAVVSEGAGSRSVGEFRRMPGAPVHMHVVETMITAGLTLFSNSPPPPLTHETISRIAPRPVFIIWTRSGVDTEVLNREYFKAAGEPKTLWEIPEAKHVGGLAARPAEYERRVVGFFEAALLDGHREHLAVPAVEDDERAAAGEALALVPRHQVRRARPAVHAHQRDPGVPRLLDRVADQRAADVPAGVAARGDERLDVALGAVGGLDPRRADAEHERADRLAVGLGDPQAAAARPLVHLLDAALHGRERLGAPLAGLAAGDEPGDRLVEQGQHDLRVGGAAGADRHVSTASGGITSRMTATSSRGSCTTRSAPSSTAASRVTSVQNWPPATR